MTTLADAVAQFSARGYTGDFRAEAGGLREVFSGSAYPAERLQIDDLARFEGESDPEDEAVVFAVSDPEGGVRGTYVVAFGPHMDRLDAEAVGRLRDARPGVRKATRAGSRRIDLRAS